MHSKRLLGSEVIGILILAILMVFPTAMGIREAVSHSHGLQASTANVNSAPGAGMTRFAEVIERNTYNAGLPDPSIMLFVGIGLVVLGICGQRRGKGIIRQ